MNIRDRQGIRALATEAISAAADSPRKLALIHTGAAVALSAVLTLLNFILTEQIGSTGGLSGMGMRSVLSTAQMMLSIISITLMPFWELGFVFAAMKLSRRQAAEPQDLLKGFRRFGPALRLSLLQGLLYLALAIFCLNIASIVFVFTPFAASLAQEMEGISATMPDMDTAPYSLLGAMVPFYCVFFVIFGAVTIPVMYRFRLAQYLIVDDPKIGALAALGTSHRLMRYNRWAMFRLDLSFWWYHALQLLCGLLAYGDVLAEAFGIALPFSSTAAFFIFFAVNCVAQLVLAWFFAAPVAVTYAEAYQALLHQYEDAEPPVVKNFPWDFLPEREQ